MSVIRKTIKFDYLDMNLKFTLGSSDNFNGYQQDIDNLTETTKWNLVNPVIDGEVRKYKYLSTIAGSFLTFYFYDSISKLQSNSFITAGFKDNEITPVNSALRNSFFIMDFYDSYDPYIQNKIFTGYLTKLYNSINVYGLSVPQYRIHSDTVNQLYNWYIPQSFINLQTGNTATGYVRFSFYNAKNGNISVFYNADNQNITTPEKMYFKVELNLVDATWRIFIDPNQPIPYPNNSPQIKAYELEPTSSFVTRVNNTANNVEDKKQNYPSGTTFKQTTGIYIK